MKSGGESTHDQQRCTRPCENYIEISAGSVSRVLRKPSWINYSNMPKTDLNQSRLFQLF